MYHNLTMIFKIFYIIIFSTKKIYSMRCILTLTIDIYFLSCMYTVILFIVFFSIYKLFVFYFIVYRPDDPRVPYIKR